MRISDWSSDVCSSDLSFGPWGIDAHYALGEADNAAGTETKIERFGFGAGYQVAPGWKVTADYELIPGENYTNDRGVAVARKDAQAILFTNSFSFLVFGPDKETVRALSPPCFLPSTLSYSSQRMTYRLG